MPVCPLLACSMRRSLYEKLGPAVPWIAWLTWWVGNRSKAVEEIARGQLL